MNLKSLSDDRLLAETLRLVRTEREVLTTILHHLREVERRRLFAGQGSLFGYARVILGYPEDQANRRIAAMRLMRELPEIEVRIHAGELNLTHLGLAGALFSSEKRSGRPVAPARKRVIIEAIANQSTRAAERTLREFATTPAPVQERVRALGAGRNQLSTEVSDETLAKLERLKGLMAHATPGATISAVIDKLCDLGLAQMDPAREPKRRVKAATLTAVRRRVWQRDGHACVICKSTYALQEDHVVPKCRGGAYTVENMRLLCRACNQRAAIETLGMAKMEPYLSPAAPRVSAIKTVVCTSTWPMELAGGSALFADESVVGR